MNVPTTDPVVSQQPSVPMTAAPTVQNGRLPENDDEEPNDEALSYEPIPPRRSFTVLVSYRFRGRGQPLPYDLDEEEGQ